MRCAECGADTAEVAGFCVRCGAPAPGRRCEAADPAYGGPGDFLAAATGGRQKLAPSNGADRVGCRAQGW
jgi:hypothetical protein